MPTSLPPTSLRRGAAPVLRRTLALQDIILLGYLVVLRLAVTMSPAGAARSASIGRLDLLLGILLVACGIARHTSISDRVRAFIYRSALVSVFVGNYLVLRDVLPIVRPDSVDASLWRLDLQLFGVEPAVWLQRFNVQPVVEWFSFFYFSYFFLCAAYVIGVVFVLKPGRHTTEFAIGSALVFCVGQLGYLLVPGYGPVRFLAQAFDAPLAGGFFWSCVEQTVAAGGAMKDIFPSLHTAGPTWLTLFALRRARQDRPWRIPAALTGFFTLNIIVSTMFLRWHYAIDVVAGLALAFTVAVLVPRLAALDASVRRSLGAGEAWIFRSARSA